MKQAKFSLTGPQFDFLEKHRDLGFSDKSALVRRALDDFQKRLEAQRLRESAELYAKLYAEDDELPELTESALEDWPE